MAFELFKAQKKNLLFIQEKNITFAHVFKFIPKLIFLSMNQ